LASVVGLQAAEGAFREYQSRQLPKHILLDLDLALQHALWQASDTALTEVGLPGEYGLQREGIPGFSLGWYLNARLRVEAGLDPNVSVSVAPRSAPRSAPADTRTPYAAVVATAAAAVSLEMSSSAPALGRAQAPTFSPASQPASSASSAGARSASTSTTGAAGCCARSGCLAVAAFKCAACSSASYCGKECQKLDWPAHKAACKRKRG
jgi:hypothetical protein